MNLTVTGKMMDMTGPEFEAFQAASRISPSEAKARELALAEREKAVARAELAMQSGVALLPMPPSAHSPATVTSAKVEIESGGVWLTFKPDWSSCAIFGDELAALRHAVTNHMTLKWVLFGEDPLSA